MKTAIYPGSFDPLTNGHLDIISRSAEIFDKVIVAVSVNSQKKPLFTIEERIEMVKSIVKEIKNVEVKTFTGLLADFAINENAKVLIKGLRAVSDFEYEFQMALINKQLQPELETLFMMCNKEYSYLSSSIVKEVARYGGDLTGLVPDMLIEKIKNKLK